MKIYTESFQNYLAKEINMTDLFTDNTKLFADDTHQSTLQTSQEETNNIIDLKNMTLTERFKQSKAETNSKLGVVEPNASALTTEQILNGGNRKKSFHVADNGTITTEKGIATSNLKDKAELMRAIRNQVNKQYGVTE
jgi:hypothetical protein